jgi:hypothetical protein
MGGVGHPQRPVGGGRRHPIGPWVIRTWRMTGRRANLELPESISEVERVSATTMADLKAIAEPINQNAHPLAELDQMACERTAKVDSSEKMDLILG